MRPIHHTHTKGKKPEEKKENIFLIHFCVLFVLFLEPSVRAELMEQVPHVAMYCHEEKDEHQWMHLVPSFLLPLVVRYLTDVNNQVYILILTYYVIKSLIVIHFLNV